MTEIKDHIFVDYPLEADPTVSTTIEKIKKFLDKKKISEFLKLNPYEKMIPYNLWYRHPHYKVYKQKHNNQMMRIRYYKSISLTPLVSKKIDNLNPIIQLLPDLSLYQPYYPETFYAVWDFLQMNHLSLTENDFLSINNEEKLGSLEALIFFFERYQQSYQYNCYHSILVGGERKEMQNIQYRKPKNNIFNQTYNTEFIKSSSQLIQYDLINIDAISLFNDIFQWDSQEKDLCATIHHFINSLSHLKEGGSVLLKMSFLCNKSWSIIFDIAVKYFKEYSFFRSETQHPCNSEIYLYLTKFMIKSDLKSFHNHFLRNLYLDNIHHYYYVNLSCQEKNPIYQLYLKERSSWLKSLKKIVKKSHDKEIKNDIITQWHKSNDLLQIKDLSPSLDDSSVSLQFKTAVKTFRIKPVTPLGLYKQKFYQELIKKRAYLNYYKRIMDTKPSNIFSFDRYHNRDNFYLTWEELSRQIDLHQNLKHIIKNKYCGELVTNAWIKMYEMLHMIPNIIPKQDTIKTFHLCEAPGAFISAINHYLSHNNQKMSWYAQTLRPRTDTDNHALQDHFGLIASYPDKWLFGDETDNSGDITHSRVIKAYAKDPRLQDIDFMTADAGLQCKPSELNEQEAFLGKINMGQIVCILACLPLGKSAIFKTFLPMSEPLTISMIYLVTHLFDNVSVVKPKTSHPTNSEVYISLQGYRGINQAVLELLYIMLDEEKVTSKTLLFNKIDMEFFKVYMNNISSLIDRQIMFLNRSYYYYYHQNEIESLSPTIEESTNNWLQTNPVSPLKNRIMI